MAMNNIKIVRVLAWAFLIISGALMLTPGGVFCISCGFSGIGIVDIVLGAVGLAIEGGIVGRSTG